MELLEIKIKKHLHQMNIRNPIKPVKAQPVYPRNG
jgi:hypothetical protein